MSSPGFGGSGPDADRFDIEVTLAELGERNPIAVGMDVLYLLTTAFFAHLFLRGFWPAVIASIPIAMFLYFGWRASRPFFVTQLIVIAATAGATFAGLVPL